MLSAAYYRRPCRRTCAPLIKGGAAHAMLPAEHGHRGPGLLQDGQDVAVGITGLQNLLRTSVYENILLTRTICGGITGAPQGG